jgi:formylglycine-generating enzyme required for sulfatase activity
MLVMGCKQMGGKSDPLAGSKPGEHRCLEIGHGTSLDFRWAPAGKFMMGSPPNEQGRSDDEDQKPVRMEDGFWIAENETTVAVWKTVMVREPSLKDKSAKQPIAQVSWYDCHEFIKRLKSPAPGWKFELPSEAQWEYACRAGSNSANARRPAELGWINVNSGGRSHPVGMKPANAWSIRDMHGNVAEWCRDAVGPDRSELAIRGGSWDSDLSARAAARNSDTPFLRINRVGFRLVLVRAKSPDSTPLPPVCKITTSRTP